MFHDTVMSLVVVVVIIGLAVIWKWTTPGAHTGIDPHGTTSNPDQAGWLGKLYDEPADPGTISFVPRPDWYFYFLFYLLRIFKWPESVILGTVGLPTIALLLLIALPFIDLRSERRPLRRPVAMGGAVQIAHLKCPSCVKPGSPMPPFANQGPANLQALATFLESSKGGK